MGVADVGKARALIEFIRAMYGRQEGSIPLHAPLFAGNEKKYLAACIDSTFVSTVGRYVTELEQMICSLTGSRFAVATVNGTSALHAALLGLDVRPGDEVLTQPLSFVATANGIRYCGADPVFLDVDPDTMGLSPAAVAAFLADHAEVRDSGCYNKRSGKRIAACVPMHTFGHPCRIEEIVTICREFGIAVVEDAAEALGSTRNGRYCGTFGRAGIFSFNGNKIITCGGGGVVVTSDRELAGRIRFLTTTAKKEHPWLYEHTEVGYNYRMSNVNAALGCAQLEQLDAFLADKRRTAARYQEFFTTPQGSDYRFVREPDACCSNYWLNAILTPDRQQRDQLLQECNDAGIMVRPAWMLLNRLPMYAHCQCGQLDRAAFIEERLVNLPSSVRT